MFKLYQDHHIEHLSKHQNLEDALEYLRSKEYEPIVENGYSFCGISTYVIQCVKHHVTFVLEECTPSFIIYLNNPTVPSIPCIYDSETEEFIELCDIERGNTYDENKAKHPLAFELLKLATYMYGRME
jgi:hypothetical protein